MYSFVFLSSLVGNNKNFTKRYCFFFFILKMTTQQLRKAKQTIADLLRMAQHEQQQSQQQKRLHHQAQRVEGQYSPEGLQRQLQQFQERQKQKHAPLKIDLRRLAWNAWINSWSDDYPTHYYADVSFPNGYMIRIFRLDGSPGSYDIAVMDDARQYILRQELIDGLNIQDGRLTGRFDNGVQNDVSRDQLHKYIDIISLLPVRQSSLSAEQIQKHKKSTARGMSRRASATGGGR